MILFNVLINLKINIKKICQKIIKIIIPSIIMIIYTKIMNYKPELLFNKIFQIKISIP
jgi:hypothetical protein